MWRDERAQRQQIAQAWRTAALMRVKRMPSLAQLLAGPAKPLVGRELARRRKEFEDMTANVDLGQLGQRLKKGPGK